MIGWLDRFNRIPWSRTLVLLGAGVVLMAFASWLVWIVWQGQWPANLAEKRLDIIGRSLFTVLIALMVVVAAIAAISKLRIVGPGGMSMDLDGAPPPAEGPKT